MKTICHAIIAIMLVTPMAVLGQSEEHSCGFTEILDEELQHDQGFQRSWFAFEQRMQQMQHQPSLRSEEIFTIPVVVHVLHTGQAYGWNANIPDEQIASAIQGLNEDFRKLSGTNGDGVGDDTGIEFCLAVRDPQGNPTNGIVRVDGSIVPNYLESGIRASGTIGAEEIDVKTLSNWPYQDYLNIWVVTQIEGNNAQSGIQGYSRFPVSSMVDGVVVLFNAVGTTGNLKPATALNRVVTHEVGHYLGLYHTFHQTNSCTTEINCSTQGDRVCDTPQTTLSPSCTTAGCGQQQVENYMDYTAQPCMNAFTTGQRTRMRNTIITQRSSLLESLGCASVTDHDAGITQIISPSGSTCNQMVTPIVRLTNFGALSLTSCVIHYSTNNENFASYNWTGNLSQGLSVNVQLPAIAGIQGANTLQAYTTLPNGTSDQQADNDESEGAFTVANGSTVTLTVSIDFFGTETSWVIRQGETVFASGGPYINNAQGTIYTTAVCLPEGCYDLIMYDSYGDGMSFTQGSYNLVNDESIVLASGSGNFGFEATHAFCVDAPEPVLPDPPLAAFTANSTQGCGSLVTTFNNSSSGATSYQWSFPGGSPASSTAANPSVTYAAPGTYNVSLVATNAGGSTTLNQSSFITVGSIPQITLNATPPACHGLTNGSIQAVASGGASFTYNWNTGSNGSTMSNIGAGSYTVTVTNQAGCSNQQTAAIQAPPALNVTAFKSDVSCHGLSDGSVSATATGGTPPYLYNWNGEFTAASVNHLPAGSYQVVVSDLHNCQTNNTVQIAQPSVIVAVLGESFNESCAGNDGSLLVNVMGGTAPHTITWSNGNLGQQLTDASAGIYTATITDANNCQASLQGEVGFDCDTTVPTTRLTDASCGAEGLYMHNIIECIPVPEAAMYQWRFTSQQIGITAEGYTAANNPYYLIEHISPNLRYGATIEVSIRVLNNDEIWSEWGEECSVSLADDIPVTELTWSQCALELIMPYATLEISEIAGAHMYEWEFSEEGHIVTAETFLPHLQLTSLVGLSEGVQYDLRVRSSVAQQWSDWGTTCSFMYGEPLTVRTVDSGAPEMMFWPNPGRGENISLRYRNLTADGDVIELEVYDGSGKLIENKRLSYYAPQGELTIQFRRKLQPGMYFLKTRMSGRIFEEKFIVQ